MPKFLISWSELYDFEKEYEADSFNEAKKKFEEDFELLNFEENFLNAKSIGVEGHYVDDSIDINKDSSGELDEEGHLL